MASGSETNGAVLEEDDVVDDDGEAFTVVDDEDGGSRASSVIFELKQQENRLRKVSTDASRGASMTVGGAPRHRGGGSERLAKRLASGGLCSRRQGEKLIRAGRVTVNGEVVDTPAFVVSSEDAVAVDGKNVPMKARPKMWLAHKLRGELVTRAGTDPQNRPTIFDRFHLMGLPPHLIPVGRLDFNSEGLLLFTNDGDVAQWLMHPSSEVPRVYRVRVHGNITASKLKALSRGMVVDGVRYLPVDVAVENTDAVRKAQSWLVVRTYEGKNREIRKMLAHLRLQVNRLIRVEYGPYQLRDLPRGAVLEVALHPSVAQGVAAMQTKMQR